MIIVKIPKLHYQLTWGSESSADSSLLGILSTTAPPNAVDPRLLSPSSIAAAAFASLLIEGVSPAWKQAS